ncbi:fungal-specific transcription factor domain-containing protein [Mycena epipterygia]|nr:fungal-specific transcription factor domain-containing protein [Mycena epipterygia]
MSNAKGIPWEAQDTPKNAGRRPCDVCRRRKIRCVGDSDGSQKCYTCVDGNIECTYLEPARKRESKSPYVIELETRVKYLETHVEESEVIIFRLHTEIARLCEELAAAQAQLDANSVLSNISTYSSPPSDMESNKIASVPTSAEQQHDARSATLQILRTGLQSVSEPSLAPPDDSIDDYELERKIYGLRVSSSRAFSGKSSSAVFVKAALDLREDVQRGERRTQTVQSTMPGINTPESYPSFWEEDLHGASKYLDADEGLKGTWTARRQEYWMFKPWENTALTRTNTHRLPPPDLVAHLAELYFTRAHIYLPVLHRPTFDRSVGMGMDHWDADFAAIVLLVCAIGSRWSNDPRILSPTGKDKPHRECGWEWFLQVTPGKLSLGQGTLCDLQHYCLAVQFLLASASRKSTTWILVGIGLRLAQDAGAHRRTAHTEPTVERELWKRAFWMLVYLDREMSSIMGRACAIQYDDFDVEQPLEVDDEYWEDPTHPFQQPPGVPSRIAFFNALLRLSHILAFTVKVLYSLGRSRPSFTGDDGWEEHFVADLDSALNRWRDQVPEHLSWDPARADPVFFDQSVALHSVYCHMQIMVHRSFIPTARKSAPTGLPSMAVCTNAARTCANMVDVQRRRKGNEPVNFNIPDVFHSALVLLLNLWSDKRKGLAPNSSRDLENVHKCMEVLRLCENRWPVAGILWDVLAELASTGQLPLESSSLSFAQAHGEPHNAVASDMAQPMSTEDLEILRMMFTSPTLQAFATTHEPQYVPPYPPTPGYFAGGDQMPPIDADIFASSTWLASQPPFAMDASSDATAMIDSDMISTWMRG